MGPLIDPTYKNPPAPARGISPSPVGSHYGSRSAISEVIGQAVAVEGLVPGLRLAARAADDLSAVAACGERAGAPSRREVPGGLRVIVG